MNRIQPTIKECFAAITAPELYRNFAIHLFVMFPAALMMCWLAQQIDIQMGIETISFGGRITAGCAAICIGGTWVWYVYGYLFLAGGGSPGTHVDGGPVRMVDTGPYTAIRHPSVLGKLLSVIGLGIAWGSTTFLVVFLPILLLYSLVSNRLIQEKFCLIRFGEQYQLYCKEVPMLIPTLTSIRRWKEEKSALEIKTLEAVSDQPPSIWNEFKWYLLGLIGLLAFFAVLLLLI